MLKRETIIDEVGVEALECSNLIGHEDTIFDMVVDTLIRLFKSSWGIKIETFGFFPATPDPHLKTQKVDQYVQS